MSGRTDTVVPAGASQAVRRGTVGQRIRAWGASALSWLVAKLPEGFALRLASIVGTIWYLVARERRDRARANLRRVVTHLAAQELGGEPVRLAAVRRRSLETLVRSAFRHAVRYYLEVARTPSVTPAFIRERLLIETPEVVDAAFAAGGPMIFVGLHFGAIELPGLYFVSRTGSTATVPMETIPDPELQRYFVRTRGKVGLRIVGLREARRELSAALRRGEPVGLVGDRDLTGGGLEVRFFGAPARLPIGPALLAIESGAPTYVVAVRRAGPGRYRGRLEPIEIPVEGGRRERLTATVELFAGAFEKAIAFAPDQWWAVFFPIWDDIEAELAAAAQAKSEGTTTNDSTAAA
jgi:phosphatidylinositol dimannoside acyltransferase